MSRLRDELGRQLAHWDDEAFAALANRGLLRRAGKDLEKQAAELVEDGADAVVVAVAEQRVRFDARGPAQAQCSCPATGVCQHILAAALSLQRWHAQAGAEAPAAEAEDPLAALHAALGAIEPAELLRHAGKAGYRWAWQFVLDLDQAQALRIGGERHLVLSFAHPRVAFRYMGGGIDGLVADVVLAQLPKYRVAALLAYRRARGLDNLAPEPARAATAPLALGKDHEIAAPPGSLEDSRERLRDAATQLIGECTELGLAHLSRGIHERFATLAVWSQGADLPRLALLLRRVADHVELLLERAGGADEHRLFDEMTLAAGLVAALGRAAARGATPTHLAGRARSRYEATRRLELIGLGASAWRSPAGYVGLTMLFWSASDAGFVSCSDARPESLRGFDPIARYRAAGPWSGLGSPAQASGRRLLLGGAQLNAQGRLSGADSAVAVVQPPADVEVLRALPAIDEWAALAQAWRQQRASLLAEPQPMKDWVVLAPTRFGTPRFDAARQALAWPLHDRDGAPLQAELAWSPQAAHAIGRIERLRPADLPPGTRLVARLRVDPAQGLVAEPLSLLRLDAGAPRAVDVLFFDPAPDDASPAIAHDGAGAPAAPALATRSPLPRVLLELRRWLHAQGERGIGPNRAVSLAAEAAGWAQRCVDAGLGALVSEIVAGDAPALAQALVRLNYRCLQLERLLAGTSPES